MWVIARLYARRILQAMMELVRSQGVLAIRAPWSRCSSGERQLLQPKEAYRIDGIQREGWWTPNAYDAYTHDIKDVR